MRISDWSSDVCSSDLHKVNFPLPELDTTTTSYPGRWTPTEWIADLAKKNGITAPKGPPGSVIFAHTNIVHGSPPNMSPWGRTMASLTLNAIANASTSTRRPDYIPPSDNSERRREGKERVSTC